MHPKKWESLVYRQIVYLIANEVKDKKINSITVTEARMSNGLRHIKIYYRTFSGHPIKNTEFVKIIPFLQKKLLLDLNLYRAPIIAFFYDDTPDEGNKINQIIENLHHE